jgi:lipopolysaccharide/colanic/teichoic acid biosynthesis glycosyltransferase
MVADAELRGGRLTIGSDARVTRVGAFLRKRKLDELAQLIDVLVGDMSLVGPRPEVPQYIAYYPRETREIVLSVRPGITDRASIEFKDESEILEGAEDPYKAYADFVLPIKIRYYTEYVRSRNFLDDLRILVATVRAIMR